MKQRELKGVINKAISGDRNAFEKLYRIFLKSILFSVSNQLDDSTRVEDTAQDIVCEMYKRIGSLKRPEAFRSWMHTIISRTCYDANIRGRRPAEVTAAYPIDDFADTLKADDEYSEPDIAAEKSLTAGLVAEIIRGLPMARRQAIIMYYYDGMNDREIAEALGVSRSTVKTNLMRARDAIKKTMEQKGLIEESSNKINAAMIAPMIMSTLNAQADAAFSHGLISALESRMDVALSSIPDVSRVPPGHSANVPSGHTLGVVGSVASVVAVAAIALTSQIPTAVIPPDASVEFVSDAQLSSVNPRSASITIGNNWHTVSWQLLRAGDIMAEGKGDSAGNALNGLPSGEYRIEWQLENPAGDKALACRDFTVE